MSESESTVQPRLFEVDKRCTGCGTVYPKTKRYFHVAHGNGFQSQCKVCKAAPSRKERVKAVLATPAGRKYCGRCAEYKLLSEFYRQKGSHDGLTARCKPCIKKAASQYSRDNRETLRVSEKRWRDANREKVRESTRRAQNTQHGLARRAAWEEANKDKIDAYHRQYREQNRERINAQSKAWRLKNRERVRWHNKLRLHRQRAESGSVSATEWHDKLALYGGRCHWCERLIAGAVHADHVMPLVLGGEHVIENLVPSCASCNLRKGQKHPDEWREQLRREREGG